jgi:hypothetical protein
MNTQIKVSKNLSVEIRVEENIVFVTTCYMGKLRTTSYDSVEDAIEQTTLPSVHNFLKSKYATN